jgi:hypothetical protein
VAVRAEGNSGGICGGEVNLHTERPDSWMMLDSLFGTGSGAMAVGLARGHHRGNAEGSRHDEPRLLAL